MIFSKTLTHWYSNNKRSFPWRQTKNPYYIWLSEIILQQTQVKQGLPYYKAFVTTYPTVFELANANEAEVLKLWQGLGYYSRARNLHESAKYIANKCDGIFPNNYKDLLKLKGVGDYTASAIASICFNEVTAVVDGNVYRALSRYFGIDTPINSTKGTKEFKKLAQELIDEKHPAEFNQAMMEFGAIQCKPSNPDCTVCPFNSGCIALQKNMVNTLPVKIKANKVKKRYFNFLVFVSENGKTIIEKREGKGIWQNLYQFPLIESDDSLDFNKFIPIANSHSLLKGKPFDMSIYNKDDLIHKLSHQHLYTKFWIVKVDKLSNQHISIKDINKYAVPVLIEKFLKVFDF